jgi:hypothetical protein
MNAADARARLAAGAPWFSYTPASYIVVRRCSPKSPAMLEASQPRLETT